MKQKGNYIYLGYEMKKIADHPALSFSMLVLIFFCYFFVNLNAIPIRIWDEARLANSALDMYLNGFSLVPRFNKQPDMWSTKPPLTIWIQALFMKLAQPNEWAVRLPSAIATLFTGIALWGFCRTYFKNHWQGFIAASVFATTFAWVYIHAGRTGDYDALLTLFITIYSFTIFLFIQNGQRRMLYLFWIALTLAVLTKGIAGMLFLPGIAVFMIFSGRVKLLLTQKAFYTGLIFFTATIAGYYIGREAINPGYIKAVWENELGGRYLNTLEEHSHAFSYYFDNMFTWRYPTWKFLVIPGFVAGFFNVSKLTRTFTVFNLSVSFCYLLIISAAKTKLEWYDLPVYVFFALQIAILFFFCYDLLHHAILKIPFTARILFFIVSFVIVFYKPGRIAFNEVSSFSERPWDIEPHQQGYFIKSALNKNKPMDNYIFIYDGYNAQIDFYISVLKSKGVTIKLQQIPENITSGNYLVANQQTVKDLIEKNYNVTKTSETFGCTEYLVK
jgi:4-amino-4-deoxy-L-arabinose transferase-like glycosyltransferase